MKIIIFLITLVNFAFASFETERPLIEKFKREQFQNNKNYILNGRQIILKKEFHKKISDDSRLLKYFFTQYAIKSSVEKWNNEPSYKAYILKRFKTSKLSREQSMRLSNMLSSLVFSDSEENLRNELSDEFDLNSQNYFNKLLKKLDQVNFN